MNSFSQDAGWRRHSSFKHDKGEIQVTKIAFEVNITQQEITKKSALFNSDGTLKTSGWARHLLLEYDREKIRARATRIKEWDMYGIMNPEFGISLIVSDVGYFGMTTVDFRDFKKKRGHGEIGLKMCTKGSLNLPPSADSGDIFFSKGKKWTKFERSPSERKLSFDFPKYSFDGHRGISGEITLVQEPSDDTMVNVVPFKDPKHFVYVQKVLCMPVKEGFINLGSKTLEFNREKNDSWGVLDWSRGVFPYRTRWWWSYGAGIINGKRFGFNFDYGFGTESSKNMLFYDGRGYHLDDVTFSWDKNDLNRPWEFTSNDGRVDLQMEPVFISKLGLSMLVLSTKGINAFGFFTGKVILDDGTKITIERKDKLFGSAEHFRHKW
ncbi:MAG: DUF2804 domain-containing protein [Promethearchaeota archaeon]